MAKAARGIKVLLISAPYGPKTRIITRQFPLGIGYIAAVLRANGYDVKIADLSIKHDRRTFLKLIGDYSPDVVGISCMTQNHQQAFRVAKVVKRALKESTVVLGGVHGTFMYREVLRDQPDIDIVAIGEGEHTMLELCAQLESTGRLARLDTIAGIAYRKNGTTRTTPRRERIAHLDDLPYPAFDLLAMPGIEAYFTKSRGLPILTSRGCPFQCAFCSTSVLHGKQYRTRQPEKIVDEIEHHVKTFGIKNVYVVDDIFTLDKKRAISVCLEIMRRNLAIKWGCSARVDTITPELVRIMKKSGCEAIFLGIESLDDSLLQKIGKGFTAADASRAVKLLLDEGMMVDTSFIIGLPGEDARSIRKIARFVKKYKINGRVLTNSLQVLPGTDICLHPEKFGLEVPDTYQSDWFQPRSFSSNLTDEDLLKEKIRIQVAAFEAKDQDGRLFAVDNLEMDFSRTDFAALFDDTSAV